MKIHKINISFFLSFLLLCLIWFKLDKDLFFFGKSCFKYNNVLPLDVQPCYRHSFEGGFALNDAGGMPIVSTFTTFLNKNGENDTINRIIKYGIQDEKIIVEVEIKNKGLGYVEIVKDSSNNMCEDCTSIRTYNKNEVGISEWYLVPSNMLPIQELFKKILSIIIIGGFVYILYYLFFRR